MSIMEYYIAKIMDSAYHKTVYRHIGHHSMTNEKVDFYCVHGGHLGFMKIVGVAQSCRSGNQARFVLEHIFITNQKKKLHCTQHF